MSRQAWLRRKGPVAVLLAALLTVDLVAVLIDGMPGLVWVSVSATLTCGFALVADRRPAAAALGAAVVLAVGSAVLSLAGARVWTMVGPLTNAEAAAVAILITTAVRRLGPRTAIAPIAALVLGVVSAHVVRTPYAAGWPDLWWYDTTEGVLFLLVTVFVAGYLRHRDQEQVRATERADAAARQRERLILAQELNDVVAHHVGALVRHARAAQTLAAADPGAGRQALPGIESTGREALDAMRRLVTTLRAADSPGPGGAPPTRTANLLTDLRAATEAPDGDGPRVRLTADLADPVPAEAATSVLRIVREATATARQPGVGAHEIEVSVRAADGVVRVRVADDGPPGRSRAFEGGDGLIGIRERVQLLGGQFSAGRNGTTGGWQVTAEVPL